MAPTRPRLRLLAALLIALLGFTAACSSGGSSSNSGSSSSTSKNSNNSSNSGQKNITVETENGSASLSLDGKLPPNWPAAFPVPPGASPGGSGSLQNSSTDTQVGVFKFDGQ